MAGPDPRRKPLPLLLEQVHRTREAIVEARCVGGTGHAANVVLAAHLDALTAYTDALTALRLPVPYALHTEMQVVRSAVDAYHG